MPRHPDTVITPNTLLVQARQRLASPQRPGQHLSRAELANAINVALDRLYPGRSLTAHYVDQRWVGKLERGEHRWPSHERRAAIRQVLGAAADADLGLYSPRRTEGGAIPARQHMTDAWFGKLPGDLAQLPGPWTSGSELQAPARIEWPHVEALQRSIALFEEWDHQHGGGLARAAMAGQLEWACRVARQASTTETVRRTWLSTAARLADLAGWACFDSGDKPPTTQRYLMMAIQMASEAEDVQQRAHTATTLGRHLTYVGQVSDAHNVVGLARSDWGEIPPLGRAAVRIVEARAHARSHDGPACVRAVALCDEEFAASGSDGPEDPVWGYYADVGQILGDAGHALFDIAITTGGHKEVDKLINRLQSAYSHHPVKAARSRALTMIRIASLQIRDGDFTGGLTSIQAGLADARGVHSSRLRDDLRALDCILANADPEPDFADEVAAARAHVAEAVGSQI
ncbi:multiprotein-bridging factor 1 family protein [Micromonospora andamanensis]|uniref:Transcriptional regulator n=1 Tax=Micromonospora andamanensis TaxID=1287068 RepID=A0ABQ4I5Y0_9ACTN|nr:hypothetical protein [Micromonospora andamanensis]GIJ13284.1 hypothetical protein Van01_64980 [Micromonospora andamanensis]